LTSYHHLNRLLDNGRTVMVKQVIDGKAYNTETARCLATVDLMGYRMDGRGRFTTNTPKKVGTSSLYETGGGAYFLVRDYPDDVHAIHEVAGQLQVRGAGIIPVTRKQALAWAEDRGLDADKIEEMFGKVAGTGDQTGAILLRVPQTLKLAIEKSAAVAGVSTNTWLMRCVERAIASEREERQQKA
jgi:hypothetical protein